MEWVILSGGAIAGLIGYAFRRNAKYQAWRRQIVVGGDILYANWGWHDFRFRLDRPDDNITGWQGGTIFVTHKRIAIYKYPEPQPLFTIQPHELRGFWRPQKYTDGINEMWIHAHIGLTWYILKIRLQKFAMQKLVRAMKDIATEEQTKAYRRRRPYIHRGLSPAFPATQNIHGAWELDSPVALYIMPLRLVIFVGNEVQQTVPLAAVQNIAVLKRMEGGNPPGLVRFTAGEETLAFAMDDYEAWASELAEAAKRTLEEPISRKRKAKDDEDDDDYD